MEVCYSKGNWWGSRPGTFRGRRTAILRSERCFETVVLASGTMGRVLSSGDRRAVNDSVGSEGVGADISRGYTGPALEKALDTFENFRGRARRMYKATKLAAVSHAMSEPASELFHFAYAIWHVSSINLTIVAHQ